MRQIHWTKLDGDKFRTKPHAFMLVDNGYEIQRKIGNRRTKQTEDVLVTYDSFYVIQFIANHLTGLIGLPKVEALGLLEQGLDLARVKYNEKISS